MPLAPAAPLSPGCLARNFPPSLKRNRGDRLLDVVWVTGPLSRKRIAPIDNKSPRGKSPRSPVLVQKRRVFLFFAAIKRPDYSRGGSPGPGSRSRARASAAAMVRCRCRAWALPQHFLCFFPEPQGHGSLGLTLG